MVFKWMPPPRMMIMIEGVDGCEEIRREAAFPSLQLPFVMVGRDARWEPAVITLHSKPTSLYIYHLLAPDIIDKGVHRCENVTQLWTQFLAALAALYLPFRLIHCTMGWLRSKMTVRWQYQIQGDKNKMSLVKIRVWTLLKHYFH